MEHLRDPVVCKHGDLVNVMEIAKVFAVEAGPQVRDQDLCALVETDRGVFEFVTVV